MRKVTKEVYVTEDGKEFDTEKEAILYERKKEPGRTAISVSD